MTESDGGWQMNEITKRSKLEMLLRSLYNMDP